MSDLTEDEQTALLIAAEGGSLAPIGRWAKPVLSLTSKGFLVRHNSVNYGISVAGHEAVAALEKGYDAALGALIERSNVAGTAQKRIIDFAEQAAQLLAAAALASEQVTGDAPEAAARKWSDEIYKRACQLLREKASTTVLMQERQR